MSLLFTDYSLEIKTPTKSSTMLLTALTKSTDEYLKALPYKVDAYQINVTTCS